ncbi:MAG: patatin-like phospholipase family protein [Chloroflexota bacterium]
MSSDNGRPLVGVALGGGVARGLAHIGVLSVLEEAGVPIDFIAGTSMGAIIGSAYAAGLTIADLRDLASRTGWGNVTKLRVTRDGLICFMKMENWVEEVVGQFDIQDLAIPFAAVASDLVSGERVVLWRGDLGRALRASSSVPGFAPPVEWDGRMLVDGGVTDNVPSDVARMLGADYVIGVDVFVPALRPQLGPLSRGLASIETLIRHAGQGPDESDRLIVPHLEGMSYFKFSQYRDLIALGEDAAREQLPTILEDLGHWQPTSAGDRETPVEVLLKHPAPELSAN